MNKKNLFLAIFIFILLAADFAGAANIALIVGLPNGTAIERCVNAEPNTDGYRIFQMSGIKSSWSYSVGLGHFLSAVEGYGSSASDGYWSFFIYDKNSQQWKVSPVGSDGGACWNGDYSSYSGHYCGVNGDIIGWVRTTWNSTTFTPDSQPQFSEFQSICGLSITNVNAFVDGKKKGNLQEGDKISAYPGSTMQFEVETSNLFPEGKNIKIDNAYLRITAQGIDADEDIEVESDEFSIRQGASKKVKLSFDVPITAKEDSYNMLIEVKGEGSDRIEYEDSKTLVLNVRKESHKLALLDFSPEKNASCNSRLVNADFRVANVGRNDESASISITSAGLGIIGGKTGISIPAESGENSIYSAQILLNFENATSGAYEISATVLYYDGKKQEVKSAEIIVENCSAQPQVAAEAPKEGSSQMVQERADAVPAQQPYAPIYPASTISQGSDAILTMLTVAVTLFVVLLGTLVIILIKKK